MDVKEKKLVDDNVHIDTATIEKDIADTQAEIPQLEREYQGYVLIGDKMSMFKATNRQIQIEERQKFIKKLENLLRLRKANK